MTFHMCFCRAFCPWSSRMNTGHSRCFSTEKRTLFPFELLRIIASSSRASQRVNRALLGGSSGPPFLVSSHSAYSLRQLNPRIVETVQCVPWTYKQLTGRTISTTTRASSRDTPRMGACDCRRPSSLPFLSSRSWSPSHPCAVICAPPSLYASFSRSL